MYASATGTVMQKAKVTQSVPSTLTVFLNISSLWTEISVRLHGGLIDSQQHVSSSNGFSHFTHFTQSACVGAITQLQVCVSGF